MKDAAERSQTHLTPFNGPAIVLAGGLGTRLREAVPGIPKCMAPVAGRPFLFYVINYLRMQGIDEFIFSLGYKHEIIQSYLQEFFPTLRYQCTIEEEPLGTGGAIKLACEKANGKNVLIVNGDTLFRVSITGLVERHTRLAADCTLALKPMQDFDRYGVVETDVNGNLLNFREKTFYKEGNINGGVYLLNREQFLGKKWPNKFSFEKDYLEQQPGKLAGILQDDYFIDIGIPADYERAQLELRKPPPDLSSIDKRWTLFLDRDGVINVDKEGSYIFNPAEFRFTKGGPALFKTLAEIFGHIIVVTNQRGVGRGLMTEDDLRVIHQQMIEEIRKAGGRIDHIYYCTSVQNDHPMRKPNPGMALQATRDFPGIDLSRSLIVGNNPSDMQFGRNAGIHTVFVRSTRPGHPLPDPDIDLAFDSLEDFTLALAQQSPGD